MLQFNHTEYAPLMIKAGESIDISDAQYKNFKSRLDAFSHVLEISKSPSKEEMEAQAKKEAMELKAKADAEAAAKKAQLEAEKAAAKNKKMDDKKESE